MEERGRLVGDFFARYAQALLDRDAETIADMYAVPALIAFPRTIHRGERAIARQGFLCREPIGL